MAEIIAEDDPDAVCTKAGWARWLEKQKELRATQAQGEPDVANANFYAAAPKSLCADVEGHLRWLETGEGTPPELLFLECERSSDARKVATIFFGGVDVDVALLSEVRTPPKPRVQVRWVGSAARRIPDLRIQTRQISKSGSPGVWEELR